MSICQGLSSLFVQLLSGTLLAWTPIAEAISQADRPLPNSCFSKAGYAQYKVWTIKDRTKESMVGVKKRSFRQIR